MSTGTLIPFGAWLKQRRKELGLTQPELAQKVACSLETIEKIEAGKRRPSRQIAALIAECLSVPAGEHDAFAEYARANLPAASNNGSSYLDGPSPWRRLHQHPNNLPAQPNAFIGRQKEVQEASALLRQPGVRLLTVTGSPGIGKTRLSLMVAEDLLGYFEDGVFFVSLAPIAHSSQVGSAIIKALGIYEDASRTPSETLKEYLRDRRILLLLDNFEHLVETAQLIADLLEAAAHLKVLVTSRMALNLYGEYNFLVPPMSVPDINTNSLADFEGVGGYEAVALFIERARAVKSDFALTPDNVLAVAQICHKLDGLPLAIELAAAHARILPPQALLPQLEHTLPLLIGGAQNVPPRQQTLRGAIAWSYDLLNSDEQLIFRRLGVFAGGCTVEAIEVICESGARNAEVNLLDILDSLVSKNVLIQDARGDGYPRFLMLESIREYALERLAERGEEQVIYRLHANYFLAFAQRADLQLRSPGQLGALEQLDLEYHNLRAALQWASDNEEIDTAYQLADALWFFWWTRNYWIEGLDWFEKLLATGNSAPRTLNRARALYGAGNLGLFLGSLPLAQSWLTESISIAREVDARRDLGRALNCLAVAMAAGGDPVEWSILEESRQLLQGSGDDWSLALTISGMGEVARIQGNTKKAIPYHIEALELFRILGDAAGVGSRLLTLGHIMLQEGESEQAVTYYKEGITAFLDFKGYPGIAACMMGMAGAIGSLGKAGLAARTFGATDALCDAFGISIPVFYRAGYEQSLMATRAQLDEATFQAEWKVGRSMTAIQAIAYALE